MEESPEVSSYKKALATIKDLKEHPNVVKWIELEGRRKVDEYVQKSISRLKTSYPLITDEDIAWILNDDGLHELLLIFQKITNRPLIIDEFGLEEDDREVVKVLRVIRGSEESFTNGSSKNSMTLSKIHLLPFEMTHLWGGGYKSMVS